MTKFVSKNVSVRGKSFNFDPFNLSDPMNQSDLKENFLNRHSRQKDHLVLFFFQRKYHAVHNTTTNQENETFECVRVDLGCI